MRKWHPIAVEGVDTCDGRHLRPDSVRWLFDPHHSSTMRPVVVRDATEQVGTITQLHRVGIVVMAKVRWSVWQSPDRDDWVLTPRASTAAHYPRRIIDPNATDATGNAEDAMFHDFVIGGAMWGPPATWPWTWHVPSPAGGQDPAAR